MRPRNSDFHILSGWGTKKSAPAAGKESIEVDHYANTPELIFFLLDHRPKIYN